MAMSPCSSCGRTSEAYLWVPRARSRHVTWPYSWISLPSRPSRTTRMPAGGGAERGSKQCGPAEYMLRPGHVPGVCTRTSTAAAARACNDTEQSGTHRHVRDSIGTSHPRATIVGM
jgi:hypothetical protein